MPSCGVKAFGGIAPLVRKEVAAHRAQPRTFPLGEASDDLLGARLPIAVIARHVLSALGAVVEVGRDLIAAVLVGECGPVIVVPKEIGVVLVNELGRLGHDVVVHEVLHGDLAGTAPFHVGRIGLELGVCLKEHLDRTVVLENGVFPFSGLGRVQAEFQALGPAGVRHLACEITMRPLVNAVAERKARIPQAESAMVLQERHDVPRATGAERLHQGGRIKRTGLEQVEEVVALEVGAPVLPVIRDMVCLRVAPQLIPVWVEARTLHVGAPARQRPGAPINEDAKLGVDEPFRAGVRVHGLPGRLVAPLSVHGAYFVHLDLCPRHEISRMLLRKLVEAFRIKGGLPVLGATIPFRGERDGRLKAARGQLIGRRGILAISRERRSTTQTDQEFKVSIHVDVLFFKFAPSLYTLLPPCVKPVQSSFGRFRPRLRRTPPGCSLLFRRPISRGCRYPSSPAPCPRWGLCNPQAFGINKHSSVVAVTMPRLSLHPRSPLRANQSPRNHHRPSKAAERLFA